MLGYFHSIFSHSYGISNFFSLQSLWTVYFITDDDAFNNAQYTYMLRMNERKALLNSIMHIVKIVEAKDIYTAGHSVRVAEYSERIARKLKLSEYDIDTLKICKFA